MHDAAGSLPLGKQRIVEIARALAADPVLLLLDEPAAGCAIGEKQELAALLRQLRGEGMTMLLVEHDMDFVMGLTDRLVVMDFGEKLAEGAAGRRSSATRACSKPTWAASESALGSDGRRFSKCATCTSPTARSRRSTAFRLRVAGRPDRHGDRSQRRRQDDAARARSWACSLRAATSSTTATRSCALTVEQRVGDAASSWCRNGASCSRR